MLLYEAPGSPYAQKIKIALREKSVPFDIEWPDSLGTGRTDGPFGLANPRTQVPMLVDGETRIFDFTIILEYIEESWPELPLLPRSPAARAAARMIEDVCDNAGRGGDLGLWRGDGLQPSDRGTGGNAESGGGTPTAVLQDWLAERLGDAPWFGVETFGWADAAVARLLHRSVLNGMGPAGPTPHSRPGTIAYSNARRSPQPSRNTPPPQGGCRPFWMPFDPVRGCGNTRLPAGVDDPLRRDRGRAGRPASRHDPLLLAPRLTSPPW